jgi:hypothetical protein
MAIFPHPASLVALALFASHGLIRSSVFRCAPRIGRLGGRHRSLCLSQGRRVEKRAPGRSLEINSPVIANV